MDGNADSDGGAGGADGTEERARAKRNAGERAAEAVEDGQVVGLGSGSTAAEAIRALGRRVDGGLDVEGVPTSFQARDLAREAGIGLVGLDQVETLDVAIDGADQVAGGDAIKGGGASHAREKVVDAAAERLLLVVDPTKESAVLDRSVPVEVLPDARTTAAAAVRGVGGEPALRAAQRKSGPVVTDNGNLVLDCDFGAIGEPSALGRDLAALPGVVAHGLFVGMASEIYVGRADGVTVRTV
jgi:ribose 5-phosphate isomerase A